MSVSSKQIGFIVHGHPARRKRFEKSLKKANSGLSSISYRVMYTKPGMASDDARNLADEGCTHIIAVGGDGTISDVINGIMASEKHDRVTAGFLPQGTANDWSKTWCSAQSVDGLLQAVEQNKFGMCDLGLAEYSTDSKHYFLNIADLGIGAEVVRRVNKRSKWMGANMTFSISILQTLLHYRNIDIHCKADDWEWSGKAKSIVAANGRYFGSGLCIAPDALPDDGFLDLVIIGDVSIADYLKYLPSLKNARKIDDPCVLYKKAKSITIQTSGESGIEADGELIGNGSVCFSLMPKQIRLLPPFK